MTSVCLSADGRWALSGGQRQDTTAVGGGDGPVRAQLRGANGGSALCLPERGWSLGAVGDRYEPVLLRLWDVATGRCLRTFEGHTQAVVSVCLSADGRWALSGSDDTTVRLWEVATGRCVRIFEGHMHQVWSVCLSADGRWALSGSKDKTLRLWRLDWELEAHDPVDWDDAARPWLENFLASPRPTPQRCLQTASPGRTRSRSPSPAAGSRCGMTKTSTTSCVHWDVQATAGCGLPAYGESWSG